MLATYTAVDGYSLQSTATAAWLMADTDANMVNDQTANSPTKTLTENGTITTAVVNTNSTTLASSGFSAANYYSLAYDADLDPGTSGFSAEIWIKYTATSSDYIFERDSATTAQRYLLFTNGDGTLSARVDDNSTVRTATSDAAYNDDEWHQIAIVFDGTDLDLYADGLFIKNATGAALNTLSNGSATLRVGLGIQGASAFDAGSIAGFELDIGNQWTAQQIKTKYESAKVLFNQLELFSIVGGSLEYEISLLSVSVNNTVSDNYTESLNGTRSGLTWYRHKSYDCATIPFARTSLPGATKFLKSTNNVLFTFDERGTSSAADNPLSVYKTSNNETLQYSNPYYQYSFSVRES